MLWLASSVMATLFALLAIAFSWPVVLLGGLSPLALLLFTFRQRQVNGSIPQWPDQWILLAAMIHLAVMMGLRFVMLSLNDIEFANTASNHLWTVWMTSLMCGAVSVLYFRQGWGAAGTLAVYTLSSFVCFYTAYTILDMQLDTLKPTAIRSARVIDKHISSSGRSTHGTLKLDAPSDSHIPATYAGSWNIYEQTKVGDLICFYEHPGAFGRSWHKVTACPLRSG